MLLHSLIITIWRAGCEKKTELTDWPKTAASWFTENGSSLLHSKCHLGTGPGLAAREVRSAFESCLVLGR